MKRNICIVFFYVDFIFISFEYILHNKMLTMKSLHQTEKQLQTTYISVTFISYHSLIIAEIPPLELEDHSSGS